MTTRIITLITLLSCFLTASFAQTLTHSNVNVGLIYPLSTNGTQAGSRSNFFSLNAIAGVSASEGAFCVAGVANVITDSATGFVAAGIINNIGGSATGTEMAGLINIVKDKATGAQVAGLMNIAGSVRGAQVAGFGNITAGNVQGVQVAGFMNKAKNANTQFAGFINIADSVKGAQIGGFISQGQDVHTQLSGFMNIAEKVKGVQIAGLINIADSSDYPIGIINIIKKGEKAIGVNVDETGTTMATFRSGGRILYGLAGAGFNGYKSNSLYAVGAGVGAHLPLSKHFRMNLEASFNTLTDFNHASYFNTSIRIFPAVKIARLEVFGGPAVGYGSYSSALGSGLVSTTLWSEQYCHRTYEMHLGFVAGLQVHI